MYGKNFDLKKEGIFEKISYEISSTYESVDDKSHSKVMSQKSTENKAQTLMS